MAPTLRRELRVQPVQPSLNWTRPESEQGAQLSQFLASDPTTSAFPSPLPFLAHSNGAIVARELSRSSTRLDRIATIGAPHYGAPLANNWLNGRVALLGGDLAARIADPIRFYDLVDLQRLPYGIYAYGKAVIDFLVNLSALVCRPGIGFCVYAATRAVVPVIPELQTNSAYLTGLNAASNLGREVSALSSRVGLFTSIPPINAEFFLLQPRNPRNYIRAREILIGLYAGAYWYYSRSADLVLQSNAYRWLDGEAALVDMDAYWADLTGSLIAYRRVIAGGFVAAELLTAASDGLVPYNFATYPGGTRNERVLGNIVHTAQTSAAEVSRRAVEVMQTDFKIAPRPLGSVASVAVAPNPATVSLAGTQQLTATTLDVDGVVLTGKAVTWASDNPGIASVSPSGLVTGNALGSTTIRASSEGYTGTAALTVVFILSISGPDNVVEHTSTTWTAVVSSGVPPYSYEWTEDGVYAGSASSITTGGPWNGGTTHTLGLKVTDSQARTGTTSRTVYVTFASCPLCLGPVLPP